MGLPGAMALLLMMVASVCQLRMAWDRGCLVPAIAYWMRCAAGIAAKQAYTDRDIITFLTNVECLEGQFDTWGTFGRGFINGLEMGGPTPIGAQKANLTEATLRYLEEVALNEQVLLLACALQDVLA